MSSGGKVGDTITMDAECDRIGSSLGKVESDCAGKTLLFSSMTLRNEKNEIFAKGRHTKFVALAWKDERNKVDGLD
jgi:acyl-coenzyme A thioesterase 13